ncbi:MAG: UvrD-helicase domain-containing protein [Candidatus Aminicenantes bacterium]|nr:UvrD-helicase domain-containing protein [Candidatus Aminicenantes bacterium]
MQKEEILTRDKDIGFPEFVILKASAGTGKTRALTLRFTQFLLSPHIRHNAPNQILAITFTRNATKEMKERIIGWLKKCYFLSAGGQPDRDLEEIRSLVTIDRDRLRSRAGEILDKILRNYSDFQVTTIDSFMSSVFKAAAVELGVSPDTEIIIDSSPVVSYAFSRLLNNIRPGSSEFNQFLEVCYHLKEMQASDSTFAWDPARELEKVFIDLNRKLAGANRRPVQMDLAETRKKLVPLEQEFQVVRERVAKLVTDWGGCSTRSRLLRYLPKNRLSDWEDYDFSILEEKRVQLPDRLARELRKLECIVDKYREIQATVFYQQHIRVYNMFLEVLERTRKERGMVFLEDVHSRLARYLETGIVPDIYFSLGTEIYHYLIDEFQDTSPLQWQNLYPLIENALSQGGSLFIVGDTKQAIYGFREADYQIMVNLINGQEGFASVRPRIAELRHNWRSRKELLEWVKKIFPDGIKNKIVREDDKPWKEAAAASLLDNFDCLPAAPDKSAPGYAELKLIRPKDKKNQDGYNPENGHGEENGEEQDSPEKTEVQNLIQELLDRGYRHSDLAILAYENEKVKQVATWLNEKGIPFIPYSALDIRSRPIIREILSFLQFLDYPLDDFNFSAFLFGHLFQHRLRADGLSLQTEDLREFILENRQKKRGPLYTSIRENFPEIWNAYFEDFFRTTGYLPLYDLVTQVYGVFRPLDLFPAEAGSLIKLLEVIKNFEGQGKSNLRDFIKFSAEATDDKNVWTIDVPENLEAVKIMTIHKAKGLGFPVVILLLYREQWKGEAFYLMDFPKDIFPDWDGYQPVRVLKINSKAAKSSSYLKRTYERYRQRDRVNKLNTLYVALTRAREELYVIGVKKRNEYPFPLLESILDLKINDRNASAESRPTFKKKKTKNGGQGPGKAIIKIIQAGKFPEAATLPRLNYYEKKRGELMHRLLASVEYLEGDPETIISEAMSQVGPGELTPAELQDVKRTLQEFLARPEVATWFQGRPGRTVHREIELADSQGRLFRADRVVVDGEVVTVIDFKSGRSEEPELVQAYRGQLKGYMSMLSDIFPGKRVSGVLMYPDLKKVEAI